MSVLFCFSSNKKTTRKISLKLIKLTRSRQQFNKNLNLFVSYASKFDCTKIKILVDLIQLEFTNTNLKAEKRYLYLTLLNHLILKNVIYLKISYESNLLSYITSLSNIKRRMDFFHSEDKEESILLLCSLAISCLNKWLEIYYQNDENFVEFLKQYKNSNLSNVSENFDIESIPNSCIHTNYGDLKNQELLSRNEEPDHFLNEFTNIYTNCESNSHSSKHASNSLSSGNQIETEESLSSKIPEKNKFEIQSTNSLEKLSEQKKIKNNEFISNELKSTTNLKNICGEIENDERQIIKNSIDKVSSPNEINNKYDNLKEKYLLLLQKNDYLQSRLNFYENYNFCFSRNIKKKKNNIAQIKLFQDYSTTLKLISDKPFLDNFRKLISFNDWILFEDNTFQIGLKNQFEGSKGTLNVYIGNKLPTRLEDFSVELENWNISPAVLTITNEEKKSLPSYIVGKQQICLNFNVKCNDIYIGVPIIAVKFLLPDSSSRRVKMPFPLVLSKFHSELKLDQKVLISKLWHSDIYLLSQTSSLLNTNFLDSKSFSNLVEKCKLGGAFEPYFEDNECIENISKVYLSGNILNHQVIIQVQIYSSICNKCKISVRSDSAMLSTSILSILMFQLDEAEV